MWPENQGTVGYGRLREKKKKIREEKKKRRGVPVLGTPRRGRGSALILEGMEL